MLQTCLPLALRGRVHGNVCHNHNVSVIRISKQLLYFNINDSIHLNIYVKYYLLDTICREHNKNVRWWLPPETDMRKMHRCVCTPFNQTTVLIPRPAQYKKKMYEAYICDVIARYCHNNFNVMGKFFCQANMRSVRMKMCHPPLANRQARVWCPGSSGIVIPCHHTREETRSTFVWPA